MAKKGGLGRGLDALIPSGETTPAQENSTNLAPVTKIVPNPHQPRYQMVEDDLKELSDSIREHGILQPLIVTYDAGMDLYTLIAGERRLRAAKLAGLDMVPVIVRSATDQERLELALIENVQRADLTPLETAEAYRQLAEDFKLSHDEIALRVGKNRVTITNTLRLLKLPEAVQQALAEGNISEGHARALLALNTPQAQMAALQSIQRHQLSVRQTEELVRKLGGEKSAPAVHQSVSPDIKAVEEKLRERLGTKVTLNHSKRGGTLVIHYYSQEELDAIIALIIRE
jgi:ParB family transcriptional regulator, chromosome partitioning protein